MEKDIDRIPKNQETDIIIRIDDFGGKTGLTIREFVKSERYTGFTKAGTRIPAEQFKNFKAAINSIDENDLKSDSSDSRPSDSNSQYQKKTAPAQHNSSQQNQHKNTHQEMEDNYSAPEKKETKAKKPSKLKDAPEELEM